MRVLFVCLGNICREHGLTLRSEGIDTEWGSGKGERVR